jgi:hypothetical protein
VTSWIARLVAAFIMGQTLFFKFTGAEEARALFTTLGAEPWGRIGTGVLELIAVVLLLVPRTAALGGLFGVGLMLGAVGAHFTRLGIEVSGDGGTLFVMALVTLAASTTVTYLHRAQLPVVGRLLPARG